MSVTTQQIKYCVFDYDDTIMKTRACKSQAIISLAKKYYNKQISMTEIEQHWGIAHHQLFENLLGIQGDALISAMQLYEKLDSQFPLLPHDESKQVLESLQQEFALVIVSSCSRSLIEKQLASSELSEIKFTAIFGAEDSQHHKPSGKVFDPVFNKFSDTNKDEMIYIGDGWKDAQAAMDAHLNFMGVDRSVAETQKMQELGVCVYPSLADIKNRLLN